MRKVTQFVDTAFIHKTPARMGNTHTDGQALYLHGNEIARHVDGGFTITSAGWKSNTTKERLNGLPDVNISQKDFKWFLNGKEWDGERTFIKMV